jgi:hypothetical protein
MKIRLLARDSKMPNIAIMKISKFHKNKGDDVDWYNPLLDYNDTNILYESQLFNFTDPYDYYPINAEIIKGGTGVDIKKKLPEEIDNVLTLDYDLYPECDYSMQFFSRGCINNCKFCVVPEKEGYIYSVEPMELNPNGKHIEVLDNNFFANTKWEESVKYIMDKKQSVSLHGVDVRIMKKEHANALNQMKHKKQIHIAWDNPASDLTKKLEDVTKWIKPYKLMCYVLIGFNSTKEQDLFRVERLKELKIDPFVMAYNKTDLYQKNFARWVNHKAVFKTVKWEDYKK